ncbi:MAG TPA: DUF222 domain-containing protein [Solirubrobacterales bacterium]|nr:DUF222 domain-containing protein [Solirubrobacterales bacterium]
MFASEVAKARAFEGAQPAEGVDGVHDLPTERLEHEITKLAAHINAGSCRWLELVAEFDRREGWGSWGCRSCAEWVAWQCAITTRSAREHVRVARRLEDLPRIHEEFASGRLSYSKVRALTRIAEPDTEEDLIELARHATASQIERVVRGLRRVTTEEAEEQGAARYLVTWWEDDGSLSIRAQLPPEEGSAFLQGLEAAHDRLRESGAEDASGAPGSGSAEPYPEGGSAEPPQPIRHTHADALVELARGGAGYDVVVHVDADVLSHDARGQVRIDDGPALAPETARRLGCDASLIPIIERGGSALTVGRKTRAVPPALRRAVEARDGRCRFPGCEHRRFLDAHHLVHWAHGGETAKSNLIMLCRHHHRFVHEGRVLVNGDADRVVHFRLRTGTELRAAPPGPDGSAEGLAALNDDAGHPIDPGPCLTGSGERMELGYAVSVYAEHLYGRP